MRPIHILLVEDSPGDARLTQEVFKGAKIRNEITWVDDGEKALQYLRKQGEYKAALRPDMVLLDLNMSRKDGREVLQEIKNDHSLKSIPVIILTTSSAQEDIFKSYQLYANCYIRKPIDLHEFIDIVKMIESFWLSIVLLPNVSDS